MTYTKLNLLRSLCTPVALACLASNIWADDAVDFVKQIQPILRKSCYSCVSGFNRSHMRFAWISLFWVGFTDLYVRLCSMGIWTDYHFAFN